MYDEDGNLKPLMLSELIKTATEALKNHGDMVVWVRSWKNEYDGIAEVLSPVSDPPEVDPRNISKREHYWQDKGFNKTFVIEGEII